jgi:hypothetical protein
MFGPSVLYILVGNQYISFSTCLIVVQCFPLCSSFEMLLLFMFFKKMCDIFWLKSLQAFQSYARTHTHTQTHTNTHKHTHTHTHKHTHTHTNTHTHHLYIYIYCGNLPWEPSTGYQIATEVTVTQIGIKGTA